MHRAAVFIVAPQRKQIKGPQTMDWINSGILVQ